MSSFNALHLLAHIVEGEIFHDGELEKAKEVEAEIQRLCDLANTFGVDAAKAQIQTRKQLLRDNPKLEQFLALDAASLDKEALKEHNKQLRKVTYEAFSVYRDRTYGPFWRTIIGRICAVAMERKALEVEKEKERFSDFGIEPPSKGVIADLIERAVAEASSYVRPPASFGLVRFFASIPGFTSMAEALLDAQRAYEATKARLAKEYAVYETGLDATAAKERDEMAAQTAAN